MVQEAICGIQQLQRAEAVLGEGDRMVVLNTIEVKLESSEYSVTVVGGQL